MLRDELGDLVIVEIEQRLSGRQHLNLQSDQSRFLHTALRLPQTVLLKTRRTDVFCRQATSVTERTPELSSGNTDLYVTFSGIGVVLNDVLQTRLHIGRVLCKKALFTLRRMLILSRRNNKPFCFNL